MQGMRLQPNHKAALCYLPVLGVTLVLAYYDPYMQALNSTLSAVALFVLACGAAIYLGAEK